MPVHPTDMPALTPDKITADMRALLADLIRKDPYGSHARLAEQAGIPGSTGQRRQFVKNDPDTLIVLEEARAAMFDNHGVKIEDALTKVAHVMNDDGNSNQLNAAKYALALRGINDAQHVEITGPEGVPVNIQSGVKLADVLNVLIEAGAAGDGA